MKKMPKLVDYHLRQTEKYWELKREDGKKAERIGCYHDFWYVFSACMTYSDTMKTLTIYNPNGTIRAVVGRDLIEMFYDWKEDK